MSRRHQNDPPQCSPPIVCLFYFTCHCHPSFAPRTVRHTHTNITLTPWICLTWSLLKYMHKRSGTCKLFWSQDSQSWRVSSLKPIGIKFILEGALHQYTLHAEFTMYHVYILHGMQCSGWQQGVSKRSSTLTEAWGQIELTCLSQTTQCNNAATTSLPQKCTNYNPT